MLHNPHSHPRMGLTPLVKRASTLAPPPYILLKASLKSSKNTGSMEIESFRRKNCQNDQYKNIDKQILSRYYKNNRQVSQFLVLYY